MLAGSVFRCRTCPDLRQWLMSTMQRIMRGLNHVALKRLSVRTSSAVLRIKTFAGRTAS